MIIFAGLKQMKNELLQKLKNRLDLLILEKPVTSEEVLSLSHEIDCLIVEYYSKRESN